MGKASRAKRDKPVRTLYHFTSRRHLPHILADGFLRTTESNVSIRGEHAGPDVVWLTDTPTAEAGHGLIGSVVDKREVRIEVRTRGMAWADFDREYPCDWRETFVARGGGESAARHWYVVPRRISSSEWVNVSVRQVDGTYREIAIQAA